MKIFHIFKISRLIQAGRAAAPTLFAQPPRRRAFKAAPPRNKHFIIHSVAHQSEDFTPSQYYYLNVPHSVARIVSLFLFILFITTSPAISCSAPQTIHKDITFIQSWTAYIYAYNDSTLIYHTLPPHRTLQLQFDQRLSSTPQQNAPGFEVPGAAILVDSISFTPQDAQISYTPDTSATIHHTFNITLIPGKYFITIRAKGINHKYSRFSFPYYFTFQAWPPFTPVRIHLFIIPQ